MVVGWSNVDAPRHDRLSIFGMRRRQRPGAFQNLRQGAATVGRRVQHYEYRSGKVNWQRPNQPLQRLHPSHGTANYDNVAMSQIAMPFKSLGWQSANR